MGLAKYYEDDMEIVQERLDNMNYYFRQQKQSAYYRNVLNQTTSSNNSFSVWKNF